MNRFKPSILLRVLLLLSAALIVASKGNAEAASSADSKNAPDTASAQDSIAMPLFDNGAPRWYPPHLSPTDSDWVELTSGEWLKGTIKGIRGRVVDFKSDKLSNVELKMKDIREIRSASVNTFVFRHRKVVIGIGRITEDTVEIKTATGEESFPRSDFVSMVIGDRDEWKLWTGSFSLGISITTGNTDQSTGNAQASLSRRGAFLRIQSDYYGHFSQTEGVSSVDNQQVIAQSDLFIYDKFFIIPARFEYYTNEFANIDMRVQPGAGCGYQFSDHSPLKLQFVGVLLYQRVEYVSTPANQSQLFESPAFLVGTTLTWDVTSFLTLKTDYTATLAFLNTSHFDQQAIIKLDIDVTKYVTLNSTLNWTRIGDPVATSSGSVPDRNDAILTFGIGLTF